MKESGEYDKIQKHFEEYPDVFADILNVLMYRGEKVVEESMLLGAPTESIYPGTKGRLRSQFRDVSMYLMKNGCISVCYMLENQTRIDRKMVLRKAGYQGALYRNQYDRKYTDVFPAVSIVLNWSRRKWKTFKQLGDFPEIAHLEDRTRCFVDDIRLHVYDMCHLPEEVRSKFTSDMRIVAEYLANPGNVEHMEQRIKHPEALLGMLGALSRDGRYQELAEKLETEPYVEGGMRMCELIQKYWDSGLEEGIKQGIEKGIEQGIEKGIEQGIERGIRVLIFDNMEEGYDKEKIVSKLVKLFALSQEQAEVYFNKYAVLL